MLYKERKLNTLSECQVKRIYIQLETIPLAELDKYLLLEMYKEVAEGVRVQCGKEYFPEDEQNPRAAQLYTITEEGRKNITTENLDTELYLAKFGYLASLSASHSNKDFKSKRIQDDQMFSSVELEVEVLKKTESFFKDWQSMQVVWTNRQRQQWKETSQRT